MRAAACLLALLPLACSKPSATDTPAKTGNLTREEVRKAVEGKTPREVVKAIGKPDDTHQTPDSMDDPKYEGEWVYYRRAVDPATGKVSPFWVEWKDGKAAKLRF